MVITKPQPLRPRDLSAKRRKGPGHMVDYGLCSLYHYYAMTVPKDKQVSKKLFRTILQEFNTELSSMILHNESFKLPMMMGMIRILKRPQSYKRGAPVDFVASYKNGFKTFHLNDHRDGHIYHWIWDKTQARFLRKGVYRFIASRANQRALAYILKNKPEVDYFE